MIRLKTVGQIIVTVTSVIASVLSKYNPYLLLVSVLAIGCLFISFDD